VVTGGREANVGSGFAGCGENAGCFIVVAGCGAAGGFDCGTNAGCFSVVVGCCENDAFGNG